MSLDRWVSRDTQLSVPHGVERHEPPVHAATRMVSACGAGKGSRHGAPCASHLGEAPEPGAAFLQSGRQHLWEQGWSLCRRPVSVTGWGRFIHIHTEGVSTLGIYVDCLQKSKEVLRGGCRVGQVHSDGPCRGAGGVPAALAPRAQTPMASPPPASPPPLTPTPPPHRVALLPLLHVPSFPSASLESPLTGCASLSPLQLKCTFFEGMGWGVYSEGWGDL